MKTLSVRDIRQRWPEAERVLGEEGEILVTRDGRPVARLLPIGRPVPSDRPTVAFDALRAWRRRFWKGQPDQPATDITLAEDRDDGPRRR